MPSPSSTTRWFSRNHADRPLSDHERHRLDAVSTLLEEMRPPQLEPGETTLTSEGQDCLILLLPHRALGGVSIVVWIFDDRATVAWAQVSGLAEYHDNLDLGVPVAGIRWSQSAADDVQLLEAIRAQLVAPVTLRMTAGYASVMVRNAQDVLTRVGEIGVEPSLWTRVMRPAARTDVTIRFTDAAPPPLGEPSNVDSWFA